MPAKPLQGMEACNRCRKPHGTGKFVTVLFNEPIAIKVLIPCHSQEGPGTCNVRCIRIFQLIETLIRGRRYRSLTGGNAIVQKVFREYIVILSPYRDRCRLDLWWRRCRHCSQQSQRSGTMDRLGSRVCWGKACRYWWATYLLEVKLIYNCINLTKPSWALKNIVQPDYWPHRPSLLCRCRISSLFWFERQYQLVIAEAPLFGQPWLLINFIVKTNQSITDVKPGHYLATVSVRKL